MLSEACTPVLHQQAECCHKLDVPMRWREPRSDIGWFSGHVSVLLSGLGGGHLSGGSLGICISCLPFGQQQAIDAVVKC